MEWLSVLPITKDQALAHSDANKKPPTDGARLNSSETRLERG